MHELGIMTGVMEAGEKSAVQAGATKVLKVTLSIGEMTEAIEDSLRFAFEVLTERTMSEGAELEINMVKPRSLCLDCGAEYEHDRFHMMCPKCGSYMTLSRTKKGDFYVCANETCRERIPAPQEENE